MYLGKGFGGIQSLAVTKEKENSLKALFEDLKRYSLCAFKYRLDLEVL